MFALRQGVIVELITRINTKINNSIIIYDTNNSENNLDIDFYALPIHFQ
jgi:hypothetical protein